MNSSGRRSRSTSARTSVSHASRASLPGRSLTAAACRSSASVPSTATAVANRRAASPSRPSRTRIARPTSAGPACSTRWASALTGSIPSATTALSSSRTKNGLPPVAVQQASTNVRSPTRPRRSRTSPETASRLRSAGRSNVARPPADERVDHLDSPPVPQNEPPPERGSEGPQSRQRTTQSSGQFPGRPSAGRRPP